MSSHLDQFTYKLIDRKPVQCANDDEWFKWFLDLENNRRVGLTTIKKAMVGLDIVMDSIEVTISTVFTSLNIIPQDMALFETLVRGGKYDGCVWRCRTWDEAVVQHEQVIAIVKGS